MSWCMEGCCGWLDCVCVCVCLSLLQTYTPHSILIHVPNLSLVPRMWPGNEATQSYNYTHTILFLRRKEVATNIDLGGLVSNSLIQLATDR